MDKFVWASRFLGSRFDLVQAGGGNTSVKNGEQLFVKASGLSIGDISHTSGFATLSLPILRQELFALMASDWREKTKKELEVVGNFILEQTHIEGGRPSIETFLHAVFKKYTFHTHPVSVNSFVASEAGFNCLKALYPAALFADYATPGIELLLAMAEFIEEAEASEGSAVIFLKNHGLIVSSNNAEEAIDITNEISLNLEQKAGLLLQPFRNAGDLFNLLYQQFGIQDLISPVMDPQLNKAIVAREGTLMVHFCPDVFIYLGAAIFSVEQGAAADLESYQNNYGVFPSIFVRDGMAFIRAKNYKKLKETEDMLRFYLLVSSDDEKRDLSGLDRAEIAYLGNWDAEKFRQGG
jgi:rhamnose utilization protein RhaD (predicted bifunctional aldolase and dehydrogenase)